MLNHITIMGRLTRDPELRRTKSEVSVTSFTVAVDRDYSGDGDKQADFIDCVAWRNTGEFVAKYFRKGSMIVVDGKLESRKWEDRDGNKRTSWEVNAGSCYFGEPKRREGGDFDGYSEPPTKREQPARGAHNVYPDADDGFDGYSRGEPKGYGGYRDMQDDGDLQF